MMHVRGHPHVHSPESPWAAHAKVEARSVSIVDPGSRNRWRKLRWRIALASWSTAGVDMVTRTSNSHTVRMHADKFGPRQTDGKSHGNRSSVRALTKYLLIGRLLRVAT